MQIKISEHFDYNKLFRFSLPSICMMIFSSIYGVIDGMYVSNCVGKSAFTAVNLAMPILMIIAAVGFMIGSGGSALVSKTLGEGDKERANRIFSMLILFSVFLGIILTVVGFLVLKPALIWFGAEGDTLIYGLEYGYILIPSLTFFILLNEFQSFFICAERPKLGLLAMVLTGATNIVLDTFLVAIFPLGIKGAAIATVIAQFVGAIVPLIYFARKNTSLLRLCKPIFSIRALVKTCTNGSSEFLTNVSLAFVNMLYNYQLMEYIGDDGVSAFGVTNYVNFIFIAIILGFSLAIAPVVSYHYGAKNHEELKNLRRRCLRIIFFLNISLFALTLILAYPMSYIFVGYDSALFDITLKAFFLYSPAFLVVGYNIFSSAFFTALNDGATSAILSTLRTLVFPTICLLLLPKLFSVTGIFISSAVAETIALGISIMFLVIKRKRFNY